MIRDFMRIVGAELCRMRRHWLFVAMPLLALAVVIVPLIRAYRLAVALHSGRWASAPGEMPPPGLGASLDTLLYWFQWDRLPLAAAASLLAGLGIVIFVYVGAAWLEDDIATGIIKQIGLARKRYGPIVWAKVTALIIYVSAVFFVALIGAVTATLFCPGAPGQEINRLFDVSMWRGIFISLGIVWLWTLFAAVITLVTQSGLVGVVCGSLWIVVEREVLKNAESTWLLALAKASPWSTSQSLLAWIYDRFSWTGQHPEWVVWVTTPPYTRVVEGGAGALYLLPVSHLLMVLVAYLVPEIALIVFFYYLRAKG